MFHTLALYLQVHVFQRLFVSHTKKLHFKPFPYLISLGAPVTWHLFRKLEVKSSYSDTNSQQKPERLRNNTLANCDRSVSDFPVEYNIFAIALLKATYTVSLVHNYIVDKYF